MPIPAGTGEAGNVSGLDYHDYETEKQKAGIQYLQVNLAILPDTLTQSFVDMHKKDIWKYSAEPSRPTLPQQLKLRSAAPEQQSLSDANNALYDALVSHLPQDMQAYLQNEHKKPLEMRNENLQALDNSLHLLAAAFARVSMTNPKNHNASFQAMQLANAIPLFSETAANMKLESDKIGANDSKHDANQAMLREYSAFLAELSHFRDTSSKGSESPNDIDYLELILASMFQTERTYNSSMARGNLQMIGEGLGAMTMLLTPVIMHEGSIPLYCAMETAGLGEAPFVGPTIKGALERLSAAFSESGKEQARIIPHYLEAVLIAATTLFHYLASNHTGPLPYEDKRTGREFTLVTTLFLLEGMGELNAFGDTLAATLEQFGGHIKGEHLATLFLSVSLFAASLANRMDFIEQAAPLLIPRFEKAAKELEGADNNAASALSAMLIESKMALESGDIPHVQEALINGLASLGFNPDNLDVELDRLSEEAGKLVHAIIDGTKEHAAPKTDMYTA